MLKLTRRLFALQPDAHYADFHERALFNHILASQDPNDGWACYMVPVGHAVQHEYERNMRDGGFTCCTGTSMESHALHADGIYYESGDKLWVNLYAPSTANWATEGVKLAVETDFPEGESATIKLTVDSPKEFTLALRKPYWAGDGFKITVNGWPVSDDVIDPYRDVPESGRPRRDRGGEMEGPSSYVELKRTWQTGDTVEIALPKSLHLEPTPDNPRVAAILWGPLVLAGDLGPEQERGRGRGNRSEPIVAPVFVAAEQPVAEWLKPVAGEPGHFRTDGVGRIPDSADRVKDVDFVPFYRLHRRTYGIYWDLFTQPEWEQKQAEYAAEKERQRQLELATVGYAQPGEMQPERDYSYQGGEGSRPVRVEGRAGRQSRSWFSFDMPVDPAHPMALVVTYFSAEWRRGPARFEILVDGQRIAEQEVERAEPPHFYDVQYPIAAGLVRGKEKVTVRFQAVEGSSVAAVFGIRTIRTGETGSETESTAAEPASDVNLAIVAKPSTSYVSGDTSTARTQRRIRS